MLNRFPLRTDQLPLFAFVVAILRLVLLTRRKVQLATVILPRLEHEAATLFVERKPSDMDMAVRHRMFVVWPPDASSVVSNSYVF